MVRVASKGLERGEKRERKGGKGGGDGVCTTDIDADGSTRQSNESVVFGVA